MVKPYKLGAAELSLASLFAFQFCFEALNQLDTPGIIGWIRGEPPPEDDSEKAEAKSNLRSLALQNFFLLRMPQDAVRHGNTISCDVATVPEDLCFSFLIHFSIANCQQSQ